MATLSQNFVIRLILVLHSDKQVLYCVFYYDWSAFKIQDWNDLCKNI